MVLPIATTALTRYSDVACAYTGFNYVEKEISMEFLHKFLLATAVTALFSMNAVAKQPQQQDPSITIYNNSEETIYPVVRSGNSQDSVAGKPTIERRIYVNETNGIKGIPAKKSAMFTLPKNMRNAGQVLIFPSNPRAIGLDPAKGAWSTNGANDIYTNEAGAHGFPLDGPFQLTEYTIETTIKPGDVGSDASDTKGIFNINFSSVDHLMLPVAVEAVSKTNKAAAGYVGTTLTVNDMQKKIENFTSGESTRGYFSKEGTIGWPHFSMPDNRARIRIPGTYNIFALANAASYLPNSGKSMLTVNGTKNGTEKPNVGDIVNGLTTHWLGWVTNFGPGVPSGEYKKTCGDIPGDESFCNEFAKTVNDVMTFALAHAPDRKDPSKVTPITNPNFEDAKWIVSQLLGFTFVAPNPNNKAEYAEHILNRSKFIALMYGVPSNGSAHPIVEDKYKPFIYPAPSGVRQKYNLNPYVWLVHKELGFDGYAFSVDDGSSYLRTPGANLVITVGGAKNLPLPLAYNSHTQRKISIGPDWALLENPDGALGGCGLIEKNDSHGAPAGSGHCLLTLGGKDLHNNPIATSTEFILHKDEDKSSYIRVKLNTGGYNMKKGYDELVISQCKKKLASEKEVDCSVEPRVNVSFAHNDPTTLNIDPSAALRE